MGRTRVGDRAEALKQCCPVETSASAPSNVEATRHIIMWFLNM